MSVWQAANVFNGKLNKINNNRKKTTTNNYRKRIFPEILMTV